MRTDTWRARARAASTGRGGRDGVNASRAKAEGSQTARRYLGPVRGVVFHGFFGDSGVAEVAHSSIMLSRACWRNDADSSLRTDSSCNAETIPKRLAKSTWTKAGPCLDWHMIVQGAFGMFGVLSTSAFNKMVIKWSMTSANADGILTDLVTVNATWNAIQGVSTCNIQKGLRRRPRSRWKTIYHV